MEQDMLEKTLKLKGISNYFEGVAGLTDHYAVSKVERGKQLIREFNIDNENTWLIGDTTHDFEVATELGVKCILIADGHQSAERLKATKAKLVGSLKELMEAEMFG
jgi:phosphoglycolate phosphatase